MAKKVAPTLDYESLLKEHNGDPFSFLSSLKKSNAQRPSSMVDPSQKAHIIEAFTEEQVAKEADICAMIQGVLDDNSLVPKDLKIDDGDMPLAKNFYEWTFNDEFAGTVMTPFLEQLIWGVVVFGEYCSRCSDVDYLLHDHKVDDSITKFLSKVCLLEHGVCPSCGTRKSAMVRSEEMPFYQELAVNAGQRSGKSAATGGMLTPYMTHRILKMQKPNDLYGIAGSTMLHGTFVALTYAQAKETLWEFYYGTLCESKWFQNYHSLLRFYEGRYGQTLLKFNDTFVSYRPRSLMWYPAGPDKRVLRGRTRIFAGIDEIGYFDNDASSNKVKTSARHVYDALDASLLTIRGAAERLINNGYDQALTGYSMNVSSPSSQNDKICSLVRQSEHSTSMYGIHRPTWEVNPTLPRNSKVIVDAYRRTPLDAEKNFGANPPLNANPFIQDTDQLAAAITEKRNPIKLQEIVRRRKKSGNTSKWAEVIKIGQTGKASMLTIDAGVKYNSFAVTAGHRDDDGNVRLDLACEIMPDEGTPLNYSQIFDEVLTDIIDARNVQVVLADRWNSLKILSDIEAHFDIIAEQYSLKYRDLNLTKSYLESGQLFLPRFADKRSTVAKCIKFDGAEYPRCFKDKPIEHLVMQMQTVQDTGVGIIKGDGFTDDIWRALALLVWGLTNEKFDEYMIDAAEPVAAPVPSLAVGRLGSGGAKTVGNAGGSSASNMVLGVTRTRR